MHRRARAALIALIVPSCADGPVVVPADAGGDAVVSPDAGGPGATTLGCDEVVTWPSAGGNDSVSYHRDRWDSAQRIRTRESRRDASFDGTVSLAWRYDEEGKEVAYVGYARDPSGSSYESFQHDRAYDEHGNLSDFRLSYPDRPNLNAPSEASVWMGTRYDNEYDAEGKLLGTVLTPYGPGNSRPDIERISYEHDAKGRCASKLTDSDGRDPITERFVYDSKNRVIEEHQTGRMNYPFACASSTTVISYDDRDRLTSRKTWVCGRSMDEGADIDIVHTYDADGARRSAIFDFLTDVVNYKVVTPAGEERWASYTIETQTPGCAAITAAIGGSSGQRCRVR